jgi:hypothetical protein
LLPAAAKHPTITHFSMALSLITNSLRITTTRAARRQRNPRTSIAWTALNHAEIIIIIIIIIII